MQAERWFRRADVFNRIYGLGWQGGVCAGVLGPLGWSLQRVQVVGQRGRLRVDLRRRCWCWLRRDVSELDDRRQSSWLRRLRRLLLALGCGGETPLVRHPLGWVLYFDGLEELLSVLQRVEGEGGVQARVDVVIAVGLLAAGAQSCRAAPYLAAVSRLALLRGAVSPLRQGTDATGTHVATLRSGGDISFQNVGVGHEAIDKLLTIHLLDDVL